MTISLCSAISQNSNPQNKSMFQPLLLQSLHDVAIRKVCVPTALLQSPGDVAIRKNCVPLALLQAMRSNRKNKYGSNVDYVGAVVAGCCADVECNT